MAWMAPPAEAVLPGTNPRRARRLVPGDLPGRRELMAAGAVAVVLGHLLLAPVTLVIAFLFVLVSRTTRWRLWWLLGPAAAGLTWILLVGPGQALADFAAGPASVLRQLGAGNPASRAGHPRTALPGIGGWLPQQLPLALPLAAAEGAVVGWLDWLHTDEWAVAPRRPGAIAALRAAVAARVIRAGGVLTRDGCVLGLVPATGAVASLDWPEVSRGMLVAGADERAVTLSCLQLIHAALRRRKPVFVLDDGQNPAIAAAFAAACRATGTPLLGDGAARADDALRGGGAALQADVAVRTERTLVGTGARDASQLWGRARAPRDGGLRDGAFRDGGLRDGAFRDGGLRDETPRDRSRWDGAGWDGARGHTALEQDAVGSAEARLRQVIGDRSAALLPADSPALAARACEGLAALAADLGRIGVDGDALVWVPHAERVPAQALGALVAAGAGAGGGVGIGTGTGGGGLVVLIATTSPAAVPELGALVGAALIRRVADPACAASLAALTGTRLLPPQAAAAGLAPSPGVPGLGPPAGYGAAGLGSSAGLAAASGLTPSAGFGPAAVPGVAPELVPCPAISARALLALGPEEFVLAVASPRRRLVAPGRIVPARLPQADRAQADPLGPGRPWADRAQADPLGPGRPRASWLPRIVRRPRPGRADGPDYPLAAR
jgi:hypothetical protein